MHDKKPKQNEADIHTFKPEQDMLETELRPEKIFLDGKLSLEAWSDILNCETQDLLKAMSVMGNSLQAVDDYLILNRRKKS